jgi:hypothetical protein
MSCLCVMCWVSLIRWWHNICMVCFCIPHPRQFFYGRMNVGITIGPSSVDHLICLPPRYNTTLDKADVGQEANSHS